jgi:branched-chain amino acid transport system substrate-binding protein
MGPHARGMRSVVGVVAVLAVLGMAAGASAQPSLKIGELAGLTGPIAVYGQNLHNARLLAVEEINARGGVNVKGTRHKIELVHLDVGNPKEALNVFERLTTVEKASLIVDGLYSAVEYAMGPVIKSKNVVVVWSAGNDPATTVGVPNAFRNNFDGGLPLMKVTESFLKKMGVKRVATYGQTGHADFKRFVEEYLPKVPGIEVVASEWHPFGEKDFFPVLTKLKGLKPDAVITHGFYSDGVTMLKQAREIGLVPGPVWLNQYGASPHMMDEASRKLFEGTYEDLFASFAMTADPPAKSKKFYDTFVKKFGERGFGPWAETGYDSIYLLAKAVEKAGTLDDIPKIIAAMSGLTTDEVPELLAPYRPGKVFDADRQAYPKIVVGQWKDAKVVPVLSDYGQ